MSERCTCAFMHSHACSPRVRPTLSAIARSLFHCPGRKSDLPAEYARRVDGESGSGAASPNYQFWCAVGPVAGWFSWCRPPGLGWYGTVMSCDVRRVGGTAALEGAFPPAGPIPASRAFSGEGCRRPARRCARRCRGPPARLGHIGARHLGAGRSYPNRCRCRLWRCELFPSSCGHDLMRAAPR